MARAMYGRRDSTLVIQEDNDGHVLGHLRGEPEAAGGQVIRQPLEEVKATARHLGLLHDGLGNETQEESHDSKLSNPSPPLPRRTRSRMGSFLSPHLCGPFDTSAQGTQDHSDVLSEIAIEDTLATVLQIVFPERKSAPSPSRRHSFP